MNDVLHNRTRFNFDDLYFHLRKKEGRIYSDEDVSKLPGIRIDHPHYHEWQARKHTCKRLIKYFSKKFRPMDFLEIGCGNGWLSANLASIAESHVIGIDVNARELQQAKRVFQKIQNLEFYECGPEDEMIRMKYFDIILFAASIQYFPSLTKAIQVAERLMKPGGEIHIIDTPFYQQNELVAARLRSKEYYGSVGFPEMNEFYFQHSLEELKRFNYKILYDPKAITSYFQKYKKPFYWICIRS